MTEKTHYRKAFNSPYLSSADIVGKTNLTIARVVLEKDKTKKTQDEFNTAYFTQSELRPGEPLKPMILNATNSKMLKTLTGSPYIDDWQNVAVTVFVDANVRFGRETVEGLRIAKGEPPATQKSLAAIQDYLDSGKLEQSTIDWINAHWDGLTESGANTILRKLKAKK